MILARSLVFRLDCTEKRWEAAGVGDARCALAKRNIRWPQDAHSSPFFLYVNFLKNTFNFLDLFAVERKERKHPSATDKKDQRLNSLARFPSLSIDDCFLTSASLRNIGRRAQRSRLIQKLVKAHNHASQIRYLSSRRLISARCSGSLVQRLFVRVCVGRIESTPPRLFFFCLRMNVRCSSRVIPTNSLETWLHPRGIQSLCTRADFLASCTG